jgi:hypothetical protein
MKDVDFFGNAIKSIFSVKALRKKGYVHEI